MPGKGGSCREEHSQTNSPIRTCRGRLTICKAVDLLNGRTVYTPLSGVPRFPIPRSANSDSPLKHHDLYGKQQLRRRCRAPLKAILRLTALRFKACILYLDRELDECLVCRYVDGKDLQLFKDKIEKEDQSGAGAWEAMMDKDFGDFTYTAWRRKLAVSSS